MFYRARQIENATYDLVQSFITHTLSSLLILRRQADRHLRLFFDRDLFGFAWASLGFTITHAKKHTANAILVSCDISLLPHNPKRNWDTETQNITRFLQWRTWIVCCQMFALYNNKEYLTINAATLIWIS